MYVYFCRLMKYQYKKSNNIIVFSKWTRKNFAIFSSLHKVIKIARLSIDICISSFSKNQSVLCLLNQGISMDISENDSKEKEAFFSEWFMVLLLGLITIDESYSLTDLHLGTDQSPYFASCKIWTFFCN